MDKKTVSISITLLVVLVGVAVWFFGRGPQQVSQHGYEIGMSLMSVCNRRSSEGLVAIESLVNESLSAGQLSGTEAGYLQGIIQRGKSGDWADASTAIRRLLEDQVTRASPLPKLD